MKASAETKPVWWEEIKKKQIKYKLATNIKNK
jgi:hypothetical protein